MAGAAPAGRPEQLWLDVARPIQTRPPRERRTAGGRAGNEGPAQATQMELRMSARPPVQIVVAPTGAVRADRVQTGTVHTDAVPAAKPGPLPVREPAIADTRPCFVTWLLGQGKSGGTIGELAKAARADRLFPRKGSADDVRARFDGTGADGDAYAALEDAERAYDRAA